MIYYVIIAAVVGFSLALFVAGIACDLMGGHDDRASSILMILGCWPISLPVIFLSLLCDSFYSAYIKFSSHGREYAIYSKENEMDLECDEYELLVKNEGIDYEKRIMNLLEELDLDATITYLPRYIVSKKPITAIQRPEIENFKIYFDDPGDKGQFILKWEEVKDVKQ